MFSQENRIWWYLIGIVAMFFIVIFFYSDYLIPFITLQEPIIDDQPYVYGSAPDMQINPDSTYQVNFFTDKGVIVAELDPDWAPQNVNNFIFLAREGYYENTRFHRVFPDFLIQGGDRNTLDDDLDNDGKGNPGYVVNDEINWDALDLSEQKREELSAEGYDSDAGIESVSMQKNALAMANAGPDTNGSQFFMVIADRNDPRIQQLNGRYTVIGQIISGASVIEAISQVQVDRSNPNVPRPAEPIILERVEVIENGS